MKNNILFWVAAMCVTILVLIAVIELTDTDDSAPKSQAPASSAPSSPPLPTFKVQ